MRHRTILTEKLRESLASALPITAIVFILSITVVPLPTSIMMAFVIGAVLLILGMGFFTLGTDMAMTPVGKHVGAAVTKSRRLWVVVLICFLVGALITVSEPDLQVLANQVPNVPNKIIVGAVAAGVGFFLVVALLRILFAIRLSYLLIGCYAVIFALAYFVPDNFLAVAFDSGGVTTGPMTVPFIMALGVGVSTIRSDSNAENDSFGLVALCSVGPILSVLILGIAYNPSGSEYTPVLIPEIDNSKELWGLFSDAFPTYMGEVAVALLPIAAAFGLFQLLHLKLRANQMAKISVGFLYTYVGLVLFLTGVNVGFMPAGNFIGQKIGELDYSWIIVPVGMIIGYFIVIAEPAVHVLNKQVFEITSGSVPKKAMSVSLSIGVSVSVGLAMLRIVAGVGIMWLLIPGYLLAIILSFFVPPIFTAIAFDSGGVASGPMTATFLLPLAMGVCSAVGGNVITDAFGVVAMVAMTPLITIQVLGLYFRYKTKRVELPSVSVEQKSEDDIIEL